MEVKRKDDGKRGMFFVEIENEIIAEMTYIWAGTSKIIIDHTEVSDKLAGKGVGKQLVYSAVIFARENSIRILPLCPFAKRVFSKMTEYSDVL